MLSFKCVVCDRGALPIFCFLINHQEKIWGEWVQTRGYQALRILHADTPTRLLSGSAHEAKTFLDNLWKPKKSTPPPATTAPPTLTITFHLW